MANPALLLIKPLIKAIGKEAAKYIGKDLAKAGVSAGLKAVSQGGLSSLDALNIARSAIDKKMLPQVAKSLGMTSKELKAITNSLNMTEARKAAVKGRNFIRNVNRFIDTPQKSIQQYVTKQIKSKILKNIPSFSDDIINAKDEIIRAVKRNALRLLEGKLKAINPNLSLSQTIWDSIDSIDLEMIFEVMEYLEADFYYTALNSEQDNPIYLDSKHKGYSKGMEELDFVTMVENMLIKGYHSTTVDGIY